MKNFCSNFTVGLLMGRRITSYPACNALRYAITARSPAGTIVLSDRGSQFRSKLFVMILWAHGMQGSMGRVASAADSAAMESFFNLLQKNILNRHR